MSWVFNETSKKEKQMDKKDEDAYTMRHNRGEERESS